MPTRNELPLRLPVRFRTHGDFTVMWAVALIGAAALHGADDVDFDRFVGKLPPVAVVGVAGALGLASLSVLDTAKWVGSDPERRGLARSSALALGFGAAILIADSTLGFDEGINVPWPAGALFYPVMGFIAEVAFHLVPLTLVVTAVGRKRQLEPRIAIAVMLLVALIEAVYQVLGSGTADTSPWLMTYLLLHMTVFGFVGLAALRRYGFAAMMWLRLVYYLIWHLIWGAVRLEILF